MCAHGVGSLKNSCYCYTTLAEDLNIQNEQKVLKNAYIRKQNLQSWVREIMCEEERMLELFKTFEKNEEWFSEHYEEFEEKLAGKIIAIKDQKMIAVKAEVEEILKELESRNEDINSVYITAIPPKGTAFIL